MIEGDELRERVLALTSRMFDDALTEDERAAFAPVLGDLVLESGWEMPWDWVDLPFKRPDVVVEQMTNTLASGATYVSAMWKMTCSWCSENLAGRLVDEDGRLRLPSGADAPCCNAAHPTAAWARAVAAYFMFAEWMLGYAHQSPWSVVQRCIWRGRFEQSLKFEPGQYVNTVEDRDRLTEDIYRRLAAGFAR